MTDDIYDDVVIELLEEWQKLPEDCKTEGYSDIDLAIALQNHRCMTRIDQNPDNAILVNKGLDKSGYPRYRKGCTNRLMHRHNALSEIGVSYNDVRIKPLIARHMVWLGDAATTKRNVNPNQIMLGTHKENSNDNYFQTWSGKAVTDEMHEKIISMRKDGKSWKTISTFLKARYNYKGTEETIRYLINGKYTKQYIPVDGPIEYFRKRFSNYTKNIFNTDHDVFYSSRRISVNKKYYNVFKVMYICKYMIEKSLDDNWDIFKDNYNTIDSEKYHISHTKNDGHLNQINPKFLELKTVKENMYDRVSSVRSNCQISETVAIEMYNDRIICNTRNDYLQFINRWMEKGYTKSAIWQCVAQKSHKGLGKPLGYIPYDHDEILRLRLIKLMTCEEISNEIGCDYTRVCQILKTYKIKPYKTSDRNRRSVESCIKLGVKKQSTISKLTGLSPAAVCGYMKKIAR